MTMSSTFDTLQFAKKLKEAGFPETQAETLSEAFRAAQTEADVASAKDLDLLGTTLSNEMKTLESALSARVSDSKAELVRWVVGAGFLQTALIAALLLKITN